MDSPLSACSAEVTPEWLHCEINTTSARKCPRAACRWPYRMRFAIFVRKGEETYDAVDQVPEQLRTRMLALRAFDAKAMLVAYDLVDGRELEAAIERQLADPEAAYLHAHFAAPGCFAARIERS